MNWEMVRLGDVCEFEGGSQPPKSTFRYAAQEGYIRLVQIQDYRRDDMAVYIPTELARRFCNKNDVMIGRYGPPVFQILRGLEGAYNVALMKAYPKYDNRLNNEFLYYLLQEENIQNAVIEQSQRSAGQTGVDKDFIENRIILLPDIISQRRIAAEVERQLAIMEKAKQAATEQLMLLKLAKEKYLEVAFSIDSFSDYEWIPIKDCTLKVGSGATPRGGQSAYHTSGIPFIRSQNVLFNIFSPDGLAYINDEQNEELLNTVVQNGDILLNITGASIGRVCVVPDNYCPANVNQHVCIIRLDDRFFPEFVSYFMATKEFQAGIAELQAGATRQALTKEQVQNFKLPLVEKSKQKRILSEVKANTDSSNKLYEKLYNQLSTINAIPAAILRQAFSGQV